MSHKQAQQITSAPNVWAFSNLSKSRGKEHHFAADEKCYQSGYLLAEHATKTKAITQSDLYLI